MIPKINIGSFNKYVFITCLKDVKKDFADYHFFHPMQKVNFTQFWDIFIIKGHLKWLTLLTPSNLEIICVQNVGAKVEMVSYLKK